ncbi:hypothetical protein HYR69_03265 [Candidatus Sumerlaeota bacterium]|nr:hypothetical protein [Candidatus Sumerlaeota bacterium]
MNLLGALVVIAACLLAIGFYRGWFSLWGKAGGPWADKRGVGLIVDPDKAKQDIQKVKDRVAELRD